MRGDQLIQARANLGLFRSDLAKILNVAETTVYRWERSREAVAEPLQTSLCLIVVGIASNPRAVAYGMALKQALAFGPTYALHVLLKIAHGEFEGCLTGSKTVG